MSLSSVIRYVRAIDTSSTTGAGKTGLAFGDFTAKYLTEGGTLTSLTTETITTLGTYQAPTSAAHIRIKELNNADPSKGIYEVHLHDSQVAVAGKNLWLMLSASGALIQPLWVPLADLSGRVPAALTSNGNMKSSLLEIVSTALTETSTGLLAAAFKKFFDKATPTGTINSLPDAVAGASGGLSIVGSAMTLSSAALQAIWDVATSGLTTAGSIGKAILDNWSTLLVTRFTAARAGYLDNLNVGGAVASQSDINALNQSASRRVILTTVGQYERPESGSTVYTIEARTYSRDGDPMNATGTPTLAATGQTTGDLSANLGAATNPATGVYRWAYTVANNATLEPVRFDFAATVDSDSVPMSVYTQVCDFVSATFTTADRTKIDAIHAKLPSKSYLAGTTNSDGDVQLDEATGAPSWWTSMFSGMSNLAQWLGLLAGKQTGNGTARTEIRATGAGSGTYDETTDSLQAIRDRGDAAWVTGGGGGGGPVTASVSVPAATARAVLQGSTIGVTRGDTLRVSLTDLGDLTGRTKLWFTVKQSKEAADSAAIIQIEETDNLTLLNGATPSNSAWGTITVTDASAGDVDIVLYASATKLLSKASGLIWDVKQSLGSNPDDATTQMEGKMNVELNVTQATS